MNNTTHTSTQTLQAKFDTDGVSIGIDNCCSVAILNSKQDFVGPVNKWRHILNVFEGPKVHTLYKVPIA